jgi:hypothetical protein
MVAQIDAGIAGSEQRVGALVQGSDPFFFSRKE